MLLARASAALPAGHPRQRFVAALCLYAQDVARGVLPGPYSDQLAELYARAACCCPTTRSPPADT